MDVTCHLAVGMSKSLNKFIEGEDDVFYDFTVEVEEEKFKCHKIVLGASSLFFQGLFRSGMKETELNKVRLENISCGTFKLIRDVLYSSADVITKENLFDIWHAAHQLHIQFLVEECEKFAVKILSLQNYNEIFEHAFILESKKVLIGIADFIIENFKVCKDQETILKLNGEELIRIVQSDKLDADTEDSVIDVIIKWMNYNCENRHYDKSKKRKGISLQVIKSKIKRLSYINETPAAESTSGAENSINENCSNTKINSAPKETDVGLQGDDKQGNTERRNSNNDTETTSNSCINDEMNSEDKETDCMQKDKAENSRHEINESHPRAKYVIDILAAARLSLASEDMLTRLNRHKLVVDNKSARDILFNALVYRYQGSSSTEWPSNTIPRNKYPHEIIALLQNNDLSLETFNFRKNESAIFPPCAEIKHNCNFSVCMGQICTVGFTENVHFISLFLYSVNKWMQIGESEYINHNWYFISSDNEFFLIPEKNFLYLLKKQKNKALMRLDFLAEKSFKKISEVPTEDTIHYAISYKHLILVFCSETNNSSNKTNTHSFDTISSTWTKLTSFEGRSQNMTSFERNNQTYLIMSNGGVYLIQQNEQNVIDFLFIKKICNGENPLYGAVNYEDTLHLFSSKSMIPPSACTLFNKQVLFHVSASLLRYIGCCCLPKSLLGSLKNKQT